MSKTPDEGVVGIGVAGRFEIDGEGGVSEAEVDESLGKAADEPSGGAADEALGGAVDEGMGEAVDAESGVGSASETEGDAKEGDSSDVDVGVEAE